MFKSSLTTAFIVLTCYLIPIILISSYSLAFMPLKDSWNLFSFGSIAGIIGAIALFIQITLWNSSSEKPALPEPIFQSPLPTALEIPSEPSEEQIQLQESVVEWENKYHQLLNELQSHEKELQDSIQDKEQYQLDLEISVKEQETYRKASEEQLQYKEGLIQECLQTAREQRSLIEKQQQHIANLEHKERELHYEIKTLLQLSSYDSVQPPEDPLSSPMTHSPREEESEEEEIVSIPSPVIYNHSTSISQTPENAKIQLKRFLDTATKMTGAHYYGSHSANLQIDNFALDIRRLFDNLNDENNFMVVVYSQRENKLLFVNNPVKTVLGWTPEKFLQNFPEIIQDGLEEWRKIISQLMINPEVHTSIIAKNRSGQSISLKCDLGAIHTGLFRQHAIGVLYPSVT